MAAHETGILRIGGIVLAVLIVIAIVLPFLVNVNTFRPKLESEMSSALGRQVKMGNLSLSIFSGSVSADDISVADDPAFSKNPFVTAKSLKIGVEVMPLIFSKTLHVTGITLEQPQITLLSASNGKWNFSSIGSTSAPAAASQNSSASQGGALSVDKLNVNDGRLLIGMANSAEKPHAYEKVNVEVTDFAPRQTVPLQPDCDGAGRRRHQAEGQVRAH